MENVPLKIQRFAYDIIYYVLWIIEITLFLRFALKLLGANAGNQIVAFVYSISLALMGPFDGMFAAAMVSDMVLEPSVLIAMVFYAIAGYILITFVKIISQSYASADHFN